MPIRDDLLGDRRRDDLSQEELPVGIQEVSDSSLMDVSAEDHDFPALPEFRCGLPAVETVNHQTLLSAVLHEGGEVALGTSEIRRESKK